jgi:type IV pilus assembly protein PilW
MKSIYSGKNKERGLTVLELIFALLIGLLLLGGVSATFILQNKHYSAQEQVTEMIQMARAAMDLITREVIMAGYDPTNTGFYGIPYSASQLQVLADLNKDGDTADTNEDIIYTYDSVNMQISRDTGGGAQVLVDNIESASLDFLDAAGSITTTTADIRQIRLSITVRASKPDSNYGPNNGYRTYTLTSVIAPPNLSL